jgi:hypothetical protein
MAGIDAFGTQWQIHDGASSYETVAEVFSMDTLAASVEDLDTTSHDSPGGYREFAGGLKDGGTLSMEINFDPAIHGDLLDLLSVTRAMKIILPAAADSAEIDFDGYLNSFSGTAPVDDKLSATVGVRVVGPTTISIPT